MKSKPKKLLLWFAMLVFCGSITTNIFQFWLIQQYDDAVVEQSITTSQLEELLRSYDVDLSREAMISRFEKTPHGPVKRMSPCSIQVGSSEYYFNAGSYSGSKIAWPPILRKWHIRGYAGNASAVCGSAQ